MKAFINRVKAYAKAEIERRNHLKIFNLFRDYTMVPTERYFDNLSLCKRVLEVPGAIVECGVWRGGMMAGMATMLGRNRIYHLFDSFEGLPPASEIDGEAAISYQRDKNSPHYFDNCRAEISYALKAMEKTRVNFEMHKGWFEDTLSTVKFPDGIALLRLDGDWYDSTMVCLQNFFPQVNEGGLIIIDDYFNWDGCTMAVHDFLSKLQRPCRINTTTNGVCFIIKSR